MVNGNQFEVESWLRQLKEYRSIEKYELRTKIKKEKERKEREKLKKEKLEKEKLEKEIEEKKKFEKRKLKVEKLEKKEHEIQREKILKIKNTVIDLGTKFGRLQVVEIAEECGEDDDLIISTLKEMIENCEIYAKYFESSKSVAFDQQANIAEIDKLMMIFKEWEESGLGKK